MNNSQENTPSEKNKPQDNHAMRERSAETESKLADLFRQAPAMIAVLRGPDHIFELANPMYMQLIGVDRQVIGKKVVEAIPEVKEQGFIELLDNVYKSGKAYNGNEVPVKLDRLGDGNLEQVYVNFVYHPILDADGNVNGIFAQGVDVTDLVKMRHQAQESERFLNTLISNLPGIAYRREAESPWSVQYASQGVYELTGYQPKDFTDEKITWYELIHPDDTSEMNDRLSEAIRNRSSYSLTYRIRTRDGNQKWISDNGQGVYDNGGQPLFSEGFATDITEQKQAEEELNDRENLMNLITDAIPGFLSYVEADERYLFANHAYEKWFGIPKNLVKDRSIREVIGEENYRSSKPLIDRVLQGEEVAFEAIVKQNNEARYVQVQYVPDRAGDGTVKGFVVVGYDITDRKEAEDALRKSQLRFKTYAEAMPQMAFISNAEGKITYYNQRWYDYVGYLHGTEGWGWKEKDIYHPDDLQRTIEKWSECVRTGELYEIEYRLKRHDGEYRWHLGRAVPVYNSTGEIEMWLGTNTDIHEHKKTVEALAESEQLFKTITNASPIALWLTDEKGNITYVNQTWIDWTGKPFEEHTGDKGFTSVYSEDQQRTREGFLQHFAQRSEFKTDLRIHRANGEIRWCEIEGRPRHSADGVFAGYAGSCSDITERVKVENKISRIQESNIAGVIYWNIDGQITEANDAFLTMSGYSKEDVESGTLSWRAITPDKFHSLDNKIIKEELIPHGRFVGLEKQFLKKDGEPFDVYISGAFLEGSKQEGVSVIIDITDRKRTEADLNYQKSLLEAKQEASPLGVLIVSPEGKILNCNKRFIEMWKMPESVVKTQLDEDALNAGREQLINPEGFVEKAKEVYKTHSKNNEKLYFKDGRIFERFGSPIIGEGGVNYGYVWYFLDITERENLAKQKDDFMGIASHELKTPVTSIKAYTQVLQSRFTKANDAQSAEMLGKMDAQLNKLTSLITDLLDVTKIEQGKLLFKKERFDFNQLLNEVTEEIQRTATKHQVLLELDRTVIVRGDRDRIGQVITNFLTNAIKYSPKRDQVVVRTRVDQDELVLSVQDFGLGLSKEDQKRVFERFYRVGESGHETYPGLGLGLYISAEIIQRHNGKIWTESEKGNGSTFYFTLPLQRDN